MDINEDGLIMVRCIHYKPSEKNSHCMDSGINCVGDILEDESGLRIRVCRQPIFIDWIQYIKYNHLLKPIWYI